VLGGLSYGGTVIPEAGTQEQVDTLAHIAAFVSDKGESVNTVAAAPPAGTQVPAILPRSR
jgi:hypothetical protein